MLKNLQLYLDLNEITNKDKILEATDYILKNKDRKIFFYTKQRYIFDCFLKYVDDKMSLEDFLQLGDITCDLSIYDEWLFIESLFEIYDMLEDDSLQNTIFVVQDNAVKYFKSFSQEKYEHLILKLKEKWVKLFSI